MNYFEKRKLQRIILKEYEDAIEHVLIKLNLSEDLRLTMIKRWLTDKGLSIGICHYLVYSGIYNKYNISSLSQIFPKLFYKKNKRCDTYGNVLTSGYNPFFYKTPVHCDNVQEIIECLEFRKDLLKRTLEENSISNRIKNFLTK
jgi:hypothetical protein